MLVNCTWFLERESRGEGAGRVYSFGDDMTENGGSTHYQNLGPEYRYEHPVQNMFLRYFYDLFLGIF